MSSGKLAPKNAQMGEFSDTFGAPDYNKPELLYYITDWWFLHPNYEFKPKELERSKYPRIEEFVY